jgi:hypothetical protein
MEDGRWKMEDGKGRLDLRGVFRARVVEAVSSMPKAS